MRKALATAAASLALVASMAVAHAQEAAEPEMPWTLGEFMTVFPEAPVELFNEIDTAGDGMITEEELQAAVDAGLIEDPRG